MIEPQPGLKVIDIYTERASLVKTYKSQFSRRPGTTDAQVLAALENKANATTPPPAE